mgnify:CR=1 FL=1
MLPGIDGVRAGPPMRRVLTSVVGGRKKVFGNDRAPVPVDDILLWERGEVTNTSVPSRKNSLFNPAGNLHRVYYDGNKNSGY